ncbi:MAG: PQQ-binding-like beta-propeller repeat protein [Anaerosomatales bacterium]|nr:PQQ-binding-like beta-propeller repeat protein [Anaerosomatales bacterium]MDT8433935.1 PQQ-binding-like beta-propeller repeat protein [Anaerosomatales bacterium]
MRVALAALLVAALLLLPACDLLPSTTAGEETGTVEPSVPDGGSRPPRPVQGPMPPTPSGPEGDGIKVSTFLGDAHRRTYGRGPVPERLDLIWKARIGTGTTTGPGGALVQWSGTGWTGQPTLVRENGRDYLLIGGYDHDLRKIDAQSGEEIWTYTFPDVIKGTNTVFAPPGAAGDPSRYIVVAGSRRGVGVPAGDPLIAPFRGVSYASGDELWRLPVPRTRSYSQDVDASALYAHGRLYAAVESGYVYALEPTATVEWERWRRPQVIARSPELYTATDIQRHGGNLVLESSPAISGTTLYISAGSGHVYGLDLEDLSIVWDFYIGSDLDGTVVVNADGHLLVAVEKQYIAGPGGVYLLDPTKPPDDAVVWYFPTEDRSIGEWLGGVIGSVAIDDATDPDRIRPPLAAFNSVDGYLYVVSQDLVDGTTIGPNRESDLPRPVLVHREYIGGAISTPVIVGDSIVTAGYDGRVRVLRVETEPAEEDGDGDGVLLRARDGSWHRVSVSETAVFSGGGSFESTPLVWEGRVYIGSRDGYLYCLGAPE